jgi:hypothetical protein
MTCMDNDDARELLARIEALEAENARLREAMVLRDALIADLADHEGAEGFSQTTYLALDEWEKSRAALTPAADAERGDAQS